MSGEQRLLFPDWPQGGVDRPTVCREKSLTRQADSQSADINEIMRRFEKTGVLPTDAREVLFADVSSVGSYQEVMERVNVAQRAFYGLSPAIRERFLNDPVAFLDFCSLPENQAELEKLGVLAAPEEAPKVEAAAGAAAPVAQ